MKWLIKSHIAIQRLYVAKMHIHDEARVDHGLKLTLENRITLTLYDKGTILVQGEDEKMKAAVESVLKSPDLFNDASIKTAKKRKSL